MQPRDFSPEYLKPIFLCPHCQVATKQRWFTVKKDLISDSPIIKSIAAKSHNRRRKMEPLPHSDEEDKLMTLWNFELSLCELCDGYMLWEKKESIK